MDPSRDQEAFTRAAAARNGQREADGTAATTEPFSERTADALLDLLDVAAGMTCGDVIQSGHYNKMDPLGKMKMKSKSEPSRRTRQGSVSNFVPWC